MVAYTSGCGKDSDAVVVDFAKTVPVEKPGNTSTEAPAIRFAIAAMISPKDTFVYYRQLLKYIGNQLGRDVQLIQRKTYGEINELLGKGQIDLAFICSGPYVAGKEKYGFELLATPEVQKSHFYQSYLIVNKARQFKDLEDLRGQVFAFTDPDSNTGKLVPTGLIWEYYHQKNPIFTSKTRIIRKSESYGIPPIVASSFLASDLKNRIRQVLFSMHGDPGGQKILNELMIDRFTPTQDEWYDSIRNMELKIVSLGK
jgi:phosphonate transport system substrate-binding protein